MAKYPKPKVTKTMYRGLRPYPHPSMDSFSPKLIEKMEERVARILANNRVLDERDNWIVAQALLVVAFRQAITNEEKSQIFRQIKKRKEEGYRLGFSENEISAINRLILQIEQTDQLGNFGERLLARRGKQ